MHVPSPRDNSVLHWRSKAISLWLIYFSFLWVAVKVDHSVISEGKRNVLPSLIRIRSLNAEKKWTNSRTKEYTSTWNEYFTIMCLCLLIFAEGALQTHSCCGISFIIIFHSYWLDCCGYVDKKHNVSTISGAIHNNSNFQRCCNTLEKNHHRTDWVVTVEWSQQVPPHGFTP